MGRIDNVSISVHPSRWLFCLVSPRALMTNRLLLAVPTLVAWKRVATTVIEAPEKFEIANVALRAPAM